MSKRQILYVVLSFIVTTVLLLAVAVGVILLQKPQVEIVWTKGTEAPREAQKARKGEWEGKEKQAISLVQKLEVSDPDSEEAKKRRRKDDEVPRVAVNALIERGYLKNTFKLNNLQAMGWKARYLKGPYYFISVEHRDGLIDLGPTWLVDVKRNKVMPKNVMANALMDPLSFNTAEHFERERQVIGAIASHAFESGVKLGGIMLIHFTTLENHHDADKIIGWTIVHDYSDKYRAYFQWIEDGEPTYADFEFDYAQKALRARNLQAANFMNLGKDFEDGERAAIMPGSFNPEADRAKEQWTGAARERCKQRDFKRQCQAMAMVLSDASQIEAVEWLLTVRSENPEAFESCKKDQRCLWKATSDDDSTFRVEYIYNLDVKTGEERVSWDVDLKKGAIIPQGKISAMAFRAVHPRPRDAQPQQATAPAEDGQDKPEDKAEEQAEDKAN